MFPVRNVRRALFLFIIPLAIFERK